MWARLHAKPGPNCDDSAISLAIITRWKRSGMPAPLPQLVVLAILALLPMNHSCREAILKEILSDPVVQAVMEADGVDPLALEVMLKEVSRNVSLARHARLWGPQSAPSYHVTN